MNEKVYSDIGFEFLPHPITGDLIRATDQKAIQQSIRNIVLTNRFERPFSSSRIAGNIRAALFEHNTPFLLKELEEDITVAVMNHEPRVTVEEVKCTSKNQYTIEVLIRYKNRALGRSEQFSLFLERA